MNIAVDLRLALIAASVWAATATLIISRRWYLAAVLALVVCAGLMLLRQHGQALLCGVLTGASISITGLRMRASSNPHNGWYQGKLLSFNPRSGFGTMAELMPIDRDFVGGVAGTYGMLLPAGVRAGQVVECYVRFTDSGRPSVSGKLGSCDAVRIVQQPQGLAATVHEVLATRAQTYAPHTSTIPGMVVGDTSMQSQELADAFIRTGLSHLSAVSGSNVAMVLGAVIVIARLLGQSPRVQHGAAAGMLLLFVSIVGTEPSVLRAAVSGAMAVASVIMAGRAQPLHTLSVAAIGLILLDSDLAVSFGFALSIAATAGIVLYGSSYVRIAIAADMATVPLIALMSGRMSLVAIPANLLAAPAVPLVTATGLLAALPFLPEWWAASAIAIAAVGAWWIEHVALILGALPFATIPMTPTGGLLISAWAVVLAYAFDSRRGGVPSGTRPAAHHQSQPTSPSSARFRR